MFSNLTTLNIWFASDCWCTEWYMYVCAREFTCLLVSVNMPCMEFSMIVLILCVLCRFVDIKSWLSSTLATNWSAYQSRVWVLCTCIAHLSKPLALNQCIPLDFIHWLLCINGLLFRGQNLKLSVLVPIHYVFHYFTVVFCQKPFLTCIALGQPGLVCLCGFCPLVH